MSNKPRLYIACLALAFQSNTVPVLADSISFSPAREGQTASLSGDVEAATIGKILLQKGSVSLYGNTITVNAVPDWLFDRDEVLSGVVFDPQITPGAAAGSSATISGIAYFTKGEYLRNLSARSIDSFYLNDNSIVIGTFTGATDTALDVIDSSGHHHAVPIASVKNVVSNKAYRFTIPTASVKIDPASGGISGESGKISFSRSRIAGGVIASNNKAKTPTSNLPGTEGGISNKALAAMVATDLVMEIAPAIVAPLIFAAPNKTAEQKLFSSGNASAGQPALSPQIYGNGSIHFYPQ